MILTFRDNFKRSLANIVRFTLAQEAEEAAVPQLQKKTSKAEARSSRSTAPEEDAQSRSKKQPFHSSRRRRPKQRQETAVPTAAEEEVPTPLLQKGDTVWQTICPRLWFLLRSSLPSEATDVPQA